MHKIKQDGFSLMEMLVVMLIAAVVIAISAPMITKKAGSRINSAGSLWTSFTGGNIGFNINTAGVSSIIGGDNNDISATGERPPKLTIGTKNNYPHIGFIYNKTSAGSILFKDKSSMAIGNHAIAEGENTIAIGSFVEATGSNTAILGGNSKNTGNNSVVIGYGVNNTESDTIVLGNKDTTVVIPGTVKFSSISIGNDIKFDFDKLLNFTGSRNVINPNADISSINSISGMQIPGFTDNTKPSQPVKGGHTIKINGKTYYMQSDKRLKSLQGENTDGIDKISGIKVYNYIYKNDGNKTPHVGVTAQDLQKIFPNAVAKNEEGYLQIRFEDMFYAMINSIKELDRRTKDNIKYGAELSELKKEVNGQKARLAAQEEEIKRLKEEIEALKKFINK